MKTHHLLLLVAMVSFFSCTEESLTVDVTYTKASAVYGDLDQIRDNTLLHGASTIQDPGKIFVANNFLLVGEEGEGIHIIDNTDPENPQNTQFIQIPGNREFYVEGDIIYAESFYDMLKIDISNRAQPIIEARVRNAFATDFRNAAGEPLLGFEFEQVTERLEEGDDLHNKIFPNDIAYFDFQQHLIPASAVPASFAGNSNNGIGSVNRIAFANDHVYVISRQMLTTFSDNGNFEMLSSDNIGWEMETIYPFQDRLYIGTQGSMEILDISNPGSPTYLTSFWHANACDPVYPVEGAAYVTLRAADETETNCPGVDNLLLVIDTEEIHAPSQVQEIEMDSPFGMTMIGDLLYVGEGRNGLKVFDASDKLNLRLESVDTNIEAYDVIPHPTRTDLILIAAPNGLNQYQIEANQTQLLSSLQF